jgi:hypothetical protein
VTAQTVEDGLSAECAVGGKEGYEYLHSHCRQLKNIPLPHSSGAILLVRRCRCACHWRP